VGRLWRADAVVRATVGREREVAVSAHALGYAVCVPLPDRQARPVDLVHPLDFAIVFIISYTVSQYELLFKMAHTISGPRLLVDPDLILQPPWLSLLNFLADFWLPIVACHANWPASAARVPLQHVILSKSLHYR
jgi:hypothetical protein